MKFSETWLREWVNPGISTEELVAQLTMAGLEVDAVEPVAGTFSGVVVGEILEANPHPDADKLRVCKVKGSPDGEMQVVCGAPNARPGIKIPFALVGAALPPGEDGKAFKIKKAKLRGVESFGMLCAQTELQAGDDDNGLWELPEDAPVGTDLNDYLKLNDKIIEVDLTPNRSDCLSIKGLARETGVLNQLDVKAPDIKACAEKIKDTHPVSLKAGQACSRYVGRVIKNVDVSAPSPLWLQEKLRRSGLRSIDPVVDVTNYILLELGQPMHAFDLQKLKGGIQVRMAKANEDITLLDEQEIKLNDDTLVIADDAGAIAVAGIMGGLRTAVSESTQDIFFESAFFHPISIAGRARAYGLHTDSSHRFERGVDYEGAEAAVERATALLIEIAGGEPGPTVVTELKDELPHAREVTLQKARIESGLGFAIPDNEVNDILTRLGLEEIKSNAESWTYSIPSWRFDMDIEADLLEELARIYGYNNLPTTCLQFSTELPAKSEAQRSEQRILNLLVARDYQEAITYSFIDPKIHTLFFADQEGLKLLNPISEDMSTMRISLLPGLVQTLVSNVNRQAQRVRLFEKGLVFVPNDSQADKEADLMARIDQQAHIAGLAYGNAVETAWHGDNRAMDFYDIKGDVEALLAEAGIEAEYRAAEHPVLHPGQSAEILFGGGHIGYIGALHPALLGELGLKKAVFVFELDLDAVSKASVPAFKPLSKFPEVSRDLAILVDKDAIWAELKAEITEKAGDYLKNLKVFDVYSGEGIDPQRKSLAFNLTFQHPSRTLNEDEITASVSDVVQHLEAKFNAKLR